MEKTNKVNFIEDFSGEEYNELTERKKKIQRLRMIEFYLILIITILMIGWIIFKAGFF